MHKLCKINNSSHKTTQQLGKIITNCYSLLVSLPNNNQKWPNHSLQLQLMINSNKVKRSQWRAHHKMETTGNTISTIIMYQHAKYIFQYKHQTGGSFIVSDQ